MWTVLLIAPHSMSCAKEHASALPASRVCAAYVSQAVLAEVKRIVEDSEIVREDDKQWPEPDRNGRQVRRA